MALNSKRMQTFYNEFLITTVTFLNQFAEQCEEKFFLLERKLTKLESNLLIIEQKLASVPSIEESPVILQNLPNVESLKTSSDSSSNPTDQSTEEPPPPPPPIPSEQPSPAPSQVEATPEPQPADENLVKISESEVYQKFFKMLKFGIPPAAVKQKMSSEGFDADLLDNPDLLIEKCPEEQ